MSKLLIFIGLTAGGWLGSWIGGQFGPLASIGLGGVGSVLGILLGWRIHRDYFG